MSWIKKWNGVLYEITDGSLRITTLDGEITLKSEDIPALRDVLVFIGHPRP